VEYSVRYTEAYFKYTEYSVKYAEVHFTPTEIKFRHTEDDVPPCGNQMHIHLQISPYHQIIKPKTPEAFTSGVCFFLDKEM
jgi:hypothetical protein